MDDAGAAHLNLSPLGNVKDELHIGVVIIVGSSWYWHILVSQPNILWLKEQNICKRKLLICIL